MVHLLALLWVLLLLPSLVFSNQQPVALPKVELEKINDFNYTCGASQITSQLSYCTVYKSCDRTGILPNVSAIDKTFHEESLKNDKSFAICDKSIQAKVQIRIRKEPDVWKEITSINCVLKNGNKTVDVKFKNTDLEFNENEREKNLKQIELRCISQGQARFDIYHYRKRSQDDEGFVDPNGIYVVDIFISLLVSVTAMAVYYFGYLFLENRKLLKYVTRKQSHHDELWLSIDRAERKDYDPEEIWSAMPLIHQQVAIEAALFLQKYKNEKFTPHLRQWIIDRGYPAGATEIILELAGLGDPEVPFYGPEERAETCPDFAQKQPAEFKMKMDHYSDRIESRIVETLNYSNRLRRRKIVFTDHRLLEIPHFFLELFLTSLGAPSHPTIHDADIPVLSRHAFGTRDDPMEEEKEEREAAARQRRPHFLHHDWDEAQRLLGSEA